MGASRRPYPFRAARRWVARCGSQRKLATANGDPCDRPGGEYDDVSGREQRRAVGVLQCVGGAGDEGLGGQVAGKGRGRLSKRGKTANNSSSNAR